MRHRKESVWIVAAAMGISALIAGTATASPIPPAPEYYVLDEPGVLTQPQRVALSSLLIEHDDVAGEQIVFAVFKTLDGEDLAQRTREVFDAWNLGGRIEGNGTLLALYLKENEARIEVGRGLEPSLPPTEGLRIIRQLLMPELHAGQSYRALSLSALEILRILQSPLVENGRAQEILRAGGFEGKFIPIKFGVRTWFVWVAFGAVFFLFALNSLASAEAHFTSAGWFRPNPWRLRKLRGDPHAGGADGSW